MRMQIIHLAGNVISFDDVSPNSIALDGAVSGFHKDPEANCWSFDHHGESQQRFTARASCEQVMDAICLGLDVSSIEKVLVNDIDADTALAVWLLQNPLMAFDERVQQVITAIGRTDAHGPAIPVHALHGALFRPPFIKADLEDEDMLTEDLERISGYFNGTFAPPEKRKSPGIAWASKDGKTFEQVETADGFEPLYKAGFRVAVVGQDLDNGTINWTVGKLPLVGFPLGPARGGSNPESLLGFLFAAEKAINPEQEDARSWGGGDTVGGSPRNEDKTSSRISVDKMGELVQEFVSR